MFQGYNDNFIEQRRVVMASVETAIKISGSFAEVVKAFGQKIAEIALKEDLDSFNTQSEVDKDIPRSRFLGDDESFKAWLKSWENYGNKVFSQGNTYGFFITD